MKHPIYMIVAVDEHHGIGKNGHLPWKLKKEYKYFRDTTRATDDTNKQNMVIMGHRTWDSLEPGFRPLPTRLNVVLTHDETLQVPGAVVCTSLEKALSLANDKIEKIFIIGGGQIFQEFINDPRLTGIYLTKVHKTFDCDTFFPKLPDTFSEAVKIGSDEENDISYDFLLYQRANLK